MEQEVGIPCESCLHPALPSFKPIPTRRMSDFLIRGDIKTYNPDDIEGFDDFPIYKAYDKQSGKVVTMAVDEEGVLYLISIKSQFEE